MSLTRQSVLPSVLKVLALCAILAGSAACGRSGEPGGGDDDGRFTIVATTTILEDLARNLAGDDARVVGIMRVAEDPHSYNLQPGDARTLAAADLVLANGLNLEATLGGVIDRVAADHTVRLAEAAGIEPLGLEVYQGAPDAHVWMDVTLYMRLVEAARDALAAADPDHAPGYQERAAAYLAELAQLDRWVREQLRSIPQAQRVIVTSHDAFNYFARAYDVEVHGVVGISTDVEPTAQDVQDLRKLVRDRNVKALFVETSVSETLNDIVRRIAADGGAIIGGHLYSDSLGPPEGAAGTYIGMIRHNTSPIAEALR